MSLRFCFAGFRHGHIFDVFNRVQQCPDTEFAGACEEDSQARQGLIDEGKVNITHEDFEDMLEKTDCDVVAVGDYYGKRGSLAVRALKAGMHVISDKPICTSVEELNEIRRLCDQKELVMGCQLDLRSDGLLTKARELIGNDEIGQIFTVTFTGQHPLMLGKRPGWYFEQGKQGGTINDIAIHGVDAIRWMAGREFAEIVAARVWNCKAKDYSFFQDGAQMMWRLDNGGGVLADVSYLAPDGCGYGLPSYWRFVIHGDKGMIEFSAHQQSLLLARDSDSEKQIIKTDGKRDGSYFYEFLREIDGKTEKGDMTCEAVLRATDICLATQNAAENNQCNVAV